MPCSVRVHADRPKGQHVERAHSFFCAFAPPLAKTSNSASHPSITGANGGALVKAPREEQRGDADGTGDCQHCRRFPRQRCR